MKLKILSWNARGANDSDKRLIIKSFLNSKKSKVGVSSRDQDSEVGSWIGS